MAGAIANKREVVNKMKMIVNHVMSADIHSGIFNDIFQYFKLYSPKDVEYVISTKPIEDANIYHYHRPHLESSLVNPSVVTIHHDLDDNDGWLGLSKFVPRYKEANTVICLNTLQQQRLAQYGIENTVVIPHGYNESILTMKPLRRFDPKRKAVIGIVSKRYGRRVKGEAFMYELFKRLNPSLCEFVLVGNGRSVEATMLRSMGFEARVFETLPYRLFNTLYHSMDFLMMCSYHEGGPANIPEAIATGTPVFTTRVGMAADLVKESVTGMFLDGDADTDGAKIMRVVENAGGSWDNLQKASQDGRDHVISWRVSMLSNVAIYREHARQTAKQSVGEIMEEVEDKINKDNGKEALCA